MHKLDPLQDPRWPEFIGRHPQASIFHTPGWLDALRRTYEYEPVAFTTSAPGTELTNGVVFCQVRSWLTGRRLVSLPFSDHCQPLAEGADLMTMLEFLQSDNGREHSKYVELRPLSDDSVLGAQTLFSKNASFGFHVIDLRPDLQTIYSAFHDSCVRRKIRRAEREKLSYEAGRSALML